VTLFDWSYTVEFSFRDRYFLPLCGCRGWPNLDDLILFACIAGAAVAGRVVDHFVHPTRTNPRLGKTDDI
jgi:hypothetical protein